MHIAYSAIKKPSRQRSPRKTDNNSLSAIRIKAYQAVCNKYSQEILAIQRYMPGWAPALPINY